MDPNATNNESPQLTRRQLEQVLESVGDALTVIDGEWRIVHMNPLALKLAKQTREAVLGRNFWEAFPKIIGTPVEARLRHAMTERVPAQFEVVGPISGRWHNTSLYPTDEGLAIFSRDVDDRKRAEIDRARDHEALRRSEQQFTRFMEHLPGLAWIKALDGRYVYANSAALRIFAEQRERVLGRTDEELFPPATAAQFVANDRMALASPAGLQTIETLKYDDGVVHHSIVSKFAILDAEGAPVGVGGMAIDITERINAEEALRETAERLAETDRRKDEFLAILGHELRNPLAPIRNALEVMRHRGESQSEARELHEMMERQVRTLSRLTDEMLDISRVTRGKVELRRELVDVAAVVSRAVETSRPLIEQRGHRLTVSMPAGALRVHADPVRLEQVLANLLNNAAKYTPPGGQIWLETEHDASMAVIRVRDTGIGLRPEVLPRLFEPFQQADRVPGRVQEGLGIGLALVRGLVELHGGTVEVKSAGAGQGSEFTVYLPLAPPARRPTGGVDDAGAEVGPTAPPRRVLIVDDNVDAAETLAMLLRLLGHDVHFAHDGPAALEFAAHTRPEIVLLDIGMPGMDGYEVARRLRADLSHAGLVLVAVTGYGQEEDRARSRAAGFDEHFVKPLNPQDLRKVLGRTPRSSG